jgi:hypothetical protein
MRLLTVIAVSLFLAATGRAAEDVQTVRIAICQMSVQDGDIAGNMTRVDEFVERQSRKARSSVFFLNLSMSDSAPSFNPTVVKVSPSQFREQPRIASVELHGGMRSGWQPRCLRRFPVELRQPLRRVDPGHFFTAWPLHPRIECFGRSTPGPRYGNG